MILAVRFRFTPSLLAGRFILGAIVMFLLIGALGGARSSAAPIPSPLRNVHRIVMLGDSITQQGGRPGGYVSQVGFTLRALYPDHPFEIINAGISGHRSNDMRLRFQRDVLDKKPDLVTISVGINDVWHGFDAEHPKGDGPNGIPLAGFTENVGAMVDAARQAGVRVILFTTTIFEDEPDSPRNKKAAEYNKVLRQSARRRGAEIADQNAAFMAAWKQAHASEGARLTVDQVHMAPAGDRLMARVTLLALGVPERVLDATLPDPASVLPQRVTCTQDFSEGAVVDWDENIYLSHTKTITRVTPGGNATDWATTAAPNGHKILPNGHHLVCDGERHAVLEFDEDGHEVRAAAADIDGRPLNAPNDLTLDPEGGFYFTDPGSSSAQAPTGSVYYVTPGGHVSLFAAGLAYPNGIVLTPDRRRLLVGESSRNRVLVWDIAEAGRPAGAFRVFSELPPPETADGKALPDGMALDAAGNLWVAHCGTGKLRVLDPSGKLVGSYDAGNALVSNLCFAGKDLDQLYVTGGEPGCLFRLDVGVPGLRILAKNRPKPPKREKKKGKKAEDAGKGGD